MLKFGSVCLCASIFYAPTFARAVPPIRDSDSACVQIRTAVANLARAEAAEAEGLHLLAHGGGGLAIVENELQQILDRTSELRASLRSVRLDPIAREASVADCLTQGYRALYEAERLSGEIERVLLEVRGYPLAATPRLARAPAG